MLNKNPNSFVVQNVLKVEREAYLKSGKYILKKVPLNNEVLQKFSCIDPAIVIYPSTGIFKTYISYSTLLRNVISDEQNNEYEKEVGMLFCNEQLPSHVQADGDDVLCLQWWLKIQKQYLLLFKMVTPILSNFNAPKVESSFSVTIDVVDKTCERMNMETYSGIQTIKYSLETNRSSNQVSLQNSFLKFNLYTSRVTS